MAELRVGSDLFEDGKPIPDSASHAWVGGANVSPDLRWTGAPAGTASFAVTCWDPDAPTTVGFVHWLLFNIDPSVTSLPAGTGAPGKNPPGSVSSVTDFGEPGWGGMAPPAGHGVHHYIFTVYALAQKLELDDTTTFAKFRFMIRDQTLATGTLTGLYEVP